MSSPRQDAARRRTSATSPEPTRPNLALAQSVWDMDRSGALKAADTYLRYHSYTPDTQCQTCGRRFTDDAIAARHAAGRRHLVLMTTVSRYVVGPGELVDEALGYGRRS